MNKKFIEKKRYHPDVKIANINWDVQRVDW
jgi:hypothetical protein